MAADLPFETEPITPQHTGRLRRLFSEAGKQAWCYYAPFLCCFSLPPRREVLVAERDGACCLLVRREAHVDLMVPPVPFSGRVLNILLKDVNAINGDRSARILWVDEEDARLLPANQFELRLKDTEYLYDPARVASASGRPYRDLRKRLNRVRREFDVCFRDLQAEDLLACQHLLKHWRRRQGRKHPFLLDWGYTQAALSRYEAWDREDLRGWCVEIGGQVAAFAMGGRMQEKLANFFIAKSDPDVRGLSEYLRWEVYRALSDFSLVNDAGDLGLPGLKQHKQKFRPVARLRVYTAEVLDS